MVFAPKSKRYCSEKRRNGTEIHLPRQVKDRLDPGFSSGISPLFIQGYFPRGKKIGAVKGRTAPLINTTIRRMEESKLKLVRAVIQ